MHDVAWTHARYAHMNDNDSLGNQIPNAIPVVARLGGTLQGSNGWSATVENRYFSAFH